MKPRLLDLFCGAGGCSMGYHLAGFDVVGVDINPQRNYPFEFHQADAMTFPLDGFDVIHASPPCQAYSRSRNNGCHKNAPRMLSSVRKMLMSQGGRWIIENVVGAPMYFPFTLCGASFGLGVDGLDLSRHRQFEPSHLMLAPPCQHRRGKTIGVYGNGTNKWHREKHGRNFLVNDFRKAMDIDWMTRKELSQAIPPAYTKWIGRRIFRLLMEDRTCRSKCESR